MTELVTESTPHEKALEKKNAVKIYNEMLTELKDIRKRKAFEIIRIRSAEGCKSDKQAERLWDVTVDGQRELELVLMVKGTEKIISSINTDLQVLKGELYNQW